MMKTAQLLAVLTVLLWSAHALSKREAAVSLSRKSASSVKRPSHTRPRNLQKKPAGDTIVEFGFSRVAVAPSDEASTLGDNLWTCSQIADVFRRQQDQGGCPAAACSFLELGGPGLCAFDLALRLSQLPVNLHPTSQKRAERSLTLNAQTGATSSFAPQQNVQLNGDPAQYDSGHRVVLQVNLRSASNNASDARGGAGKDPCSPSFLLEVVQKLLIRDAVHTAVLMLPAYAPSCRQNQFTQVASAFLDAGFTAFWGGFDGLDVSRNLGQVFEDNRFGQYSVNLFLARSNGGSSRRYDVANADNDNDKPRRFPKLHMLVPLRIRDESRRRSSMQHLCRYLVDTANVNNLTLHVVGLTIPGDELNHPVGIYQKLLILRHALSLPSIDPSDVVAVLDATDAVAQTSSDSLLQRYLRAGAPVYRVSTDFRIWPHAVLPYVHLYDSINRVNVVNKYINSGSYIGRAMIISKYMQDAAALVTGRPSNASWLPCEVDTFTRVNSDQGILSFSYLLGRPHNPYGVSLDYANIFTHSLLCSSYFLRLSASSSSRHPARRLFYNVTGASPAFLHGNGNSKIHLETLRSAVLGLGSFAAAEAPAAGDGGYTPDPGYRLQVDGRWTSYGKFCGTIGRKAVIYKKVEPCRLPNSTFNLRAHLKAARSKA